ncbi:SNF2 helicase, putative [Plasmodium ovale]|uniref:Chromodomain-helicase-DNA-binding protein 1 homolog, putative n=2 Tax=Plasmodium ovale TaxID=36330 RepID=A0A1D3TG36_PLAOA|nr:SNF2 helicase, putative (CHD1) [Plasmodium ovale curtisi]SBS84006.1 SNF2 helicase, putative (CHD1) [Plasmodium ovale curtisi]SCP03870.1 SNF2 helicase, putative [Plasmodium ovale]
MGDYTNNNCENDNFVNENKNISNIMPHFSAGESTVDGINASVNNSSISGLSKNSKSFEDMLPCMNTMNSNSNNNKKNGGNNNVGSNSGSYCNVRDGTHYGDMMNSENSSMNNATSNYMTQVNNNNKNLASCAPYLNSANSGMGRLKGNSNVNANVGSSVGNNVSNSVSNNNNVSGGNYGSAMGNSDNATISITNSLLNNNEKNMHMRQQLGISKNCGGGALHHDSYQKSLLSYNMNNNMSMGSVNHPMNNNTMNRYNVMNNYSVQDMNQNMIMNNMKSASSSMQSNDIKSNSKDPNYISQNNVKQNSYMNNVYYQRNDMLLRNNSNTYNMPGNFYPYMNNGFYGSTSNCFKTNTNVMNSSNTVPPGNYNHANGSSSYEGPTRGAVGAIATSNGGGGSGNNFINNSSASNFGENTNCNVGNMLNNNPGSMDKSGQMKSTLPNSMNSDGLHISANGGSSNNTNVVNGNSGNSAGSSNLNPSANLKNLSSNNSMSKGGNNAGDSSTFPNNMLMNMVNNNLIMNSKMGVSAGGNNNKGMNMSINASAMNAGCMNASGMNPGGMNSANLNVMNNMGNVAAQYRTNNSLEKQSTQGDVNSMRYHTMNMYSKMGYNSVNDYAYDNFSMNHLTEKNDNSNLISKEKGVKEESFENERGINNVNGGVGTSLAEGNGGHGSRARKNKGATDLHYGANGMINNDIGAFKKYSNNDLDGNHSNVKDGKNDVNDYNGNNNELMNNLNSGNNNTYTLFPNYNLKYPMNVDMFNNSNAYNIPNKSSGNVNNNYSNLNILNNLGDMNNAYSNMNKMTNINNYNIINSYGNGNSGGGSGNGIKSLENVKAYNESLMGGNANGGGGHHGNSNLSNIININNINNYNNMNYINNRNYANDMNMRLLNSRNMNSGAGGEEMNNGAMHMGALGTMGSISGIGGLNVGNGMSAGIGGGMNIGSTINMGVGMNMGNSIHMNTNSGVGGGGGNRYVRRSAVGKPAARTKKGETQKKEKKKKKKKKNVNNSIESEEEDDNELYVNSYVKKVTTKGSTGGGVGSGRKSLHYDPVEEKYHEKMKRSEKNDVFVSPNIGTVEGGRANLRERRKVYNYAQLDNYYETDEEDKKVDEEKYLQKQEKQSMGGIDRVLHHRKITNYDNINNISNNPFLHINKKISDTKRNDAVQNEGNGPSQAVDGEYVAGKEAVNGDGNSGGGDGQANEGKKGSANGENDDAALDDFYEEEDIVDVNEVEFLVKWIGKSHIHNFFCTYDYLKHFNGVKKVDNYIKKIKLSFQKRKFMTADEIEQEKIYSEIKKQIEMDAIHAERIVTHKVCEMTNEQIFLVKWMSCAYDQCTEETKQTLIDHGFEKLIEEYFDRESKMYGMKAMASVWNRGPLTATKFDPYNETPFYLNERKLRAYQLTGLNWMVSRMKRNLSVLLADEMGLGKTVQTIAVVGHMLYKEKLVGPYLVIVPQSTVDNWLNEFKSWLPQANVVCYHGNAVSRELIRTYELKKVYVPNKGYRYKFDVCITTPSILNSVSDVELLKKMPWQLMVVDEAHQLKNRQSKRFIELKQFMAESKLLLSGTPLHNNLEELWTLLHFLNPQQYTYYEAFQKKYNEIENTNLIGEAKQKQLMQLQHELHEVILRRVKKDVEKSLPNKVERILRVELSPIQIEFYKNILTKNYEQLAKASGGAKNSLQNICMELKKVCNHPFLCCEPVDKDEYRERLVYSSGKICLLEKLLIRLKERGNRVLIFSQMVKMLNILSEYLTLRGFKHQRLDGTMTKEMRKKAMNHFNSKNSDDFVFLLSTKAGGLGINLTSADTVIIYDSDWNPQNDLQAGARAHRIGQTKTVQIYRLVTKDSIEQTILERAKVKMVLDTLVVQGLNKKQNDNVNYIGGEGGNSSNGFTREELSKILKFGAQKLWEKNSSKYSPQKMDEEKNIIKGVDVDLDKILEEAEANENANNGNKDLNSELNNLQNSSNFFGSSGNNIFGNGSSNVANASGGGGIADDLLSSYNNITEFKYEPPANLKSNIYNDSTKAEGLDEEENDKDFWDKTIPLEERLKLKRMKEEELLVHGPRKTRTRDVRNTIDMDTNVNNNMLNEDEDDSEEYTIKYNDRNKHIKKKRRRRTSTHITEKDKFRLYRSLLKFGNPSLRLEDIQEDSKLVKVDKNVLLMELNIIVDTCKEIVERVSKENIIAKAAVSGETATGVVTGESVETGRKVTETEGGSVLKIKEEESNVTTMESTNLTTASGDDAITNRLEGSDGNGKNNVHDEGEEEDTMGGNNKEEDGEEVKKSGGILSKFMSLMKAGGATEEATTIDAVKGEVKDELADQVKDELADQVKDELSGQVKDEMSGNQPATVKENENNSNDESDGNNKVKGVERGRKIDAYTFHIGTNRANALDLCQRLQLFKSLHDFVKEQNNDNEYSFKLPLKSNSDPEPLEDNKFVKGGKIKSKKEEALAGAGSEKEEAISAAASSSAAALGMEGGEGRGEAVVGDWLKLKLPDCIFHHLRDLATKDVKAWSKEDDENLIRGVYVYGFGSFNEICSDVNLNLAHMKTIKCDKVKMRCVRILKMIEEYNSCSREETAGKKRRRTRSRNKNGELGKGMSGNATNPQKGEDNNGGGVVHTPKGSSTSRPSYYSRRSSERVKAIYMHEDKEGGGDNTVVLKKRATGGGNYKKGEKNNIVLENGDGNALVRQSTITNTAAVLLPTHEKKKGKMITLRNEKLNNVGTIDSSECSSSNENKSNFSKEEDDEEEEEEEDEEEEDEEEEEEENANMVRRSHRNSRKQSYENHKITRRRSTRMRRSGNDSVLGSEVCVNSNEDYGEIETAGMVEEAESVTVGGGASTGGDWKRDKKNEKRKKKKKKKVSDEEIISKVRNANLREMDQHSINKLTKRYIKKYKKLLKVVKRVLPLSIEKQDHDEKAHCLGVAEKANEFILFIGTYMEKLADACTDGECKVVLRNSGWEYISKCVNQPGQQLKEKYEQLKTSGNLDNSNITEEQLSTFFLARKSGNGEGSAHLSGKGEKLYDENGTDKPHTMNCGDPMRNSNFVNEDDKDGKECVLRANDCEEHHRPVENHQEKQAAVG